MILAVTGGKGGVGKSTVSLNLAAELEAIVVDADLGMADLPPGEGPDLHDVLAGRADPMEAVRDHGPVSLVPCGRSLAGAAAADPTELASVLRTVARLRGAAVIDCPAGLGSDGGIALLTADACVLVTQPSESALADALRVRELAREVETPLARVVLNRAGNVDTQRVATALGGPVTRLPESTALARAQRAGLPVTVTAPDSTAAEQISDLASAVHSALNAT